MEKKANIYDEKIYLSGDKDVEAALLNEREVRKANLEIERSRYDSVIRQYNFLLLQLRGLFEQFNFATSKETLIALQYLIKHGYISLGKKFKYDEMPDDVKARYGMSIILGSGCCRNITDMGYDLLRLLDFYTRKLYCYKPNLSLPPSASKKQANHVINLIEDEGTKYGFDITFGCELFRFKNSTTLQKVTMGPVYQMRYKPYYEIITGESSFPEMRRHIQEFTEDSKKPTIAPIEFEEGIRPDVFAFMERHKDMCEEFYEENKDIMGSIVLSLTRF